MNQETVVLLHGAGTGAWVWDRAIPLIAAPTVALSVPSRSPDATPASCASSIVRELDACGVEPIVLVMHSLAGVLAADIAARLGDRLAACIYISAVIPGEGSSFVRAIEFPGRLLLPLLFRLRPGGLVPSEATIRKELCGDLSQDDCAMVVERYEAEFPGLYLSRVAGPPRCRSAYVKLLDDASVPAALQDRMAEQLDSPTIFEVSSGHMGMLAQPDELAGIINRFVQTA